MVKVKPAALPCCGRLLPEQSGRYANEQKISQDMCENQKESHKTKACFGNPPAR